MGSREDDAYWNTKYAEASCHVHGEDGMYYDGGADEWYCQDCENDDENLGAYNNG
jgi:hypothetical protein